MKQYAWDVNWWEENKTLVKGHYNETENDMINQNCDTCYKIARESRM